MLARQGSGMLAKVLIVLLLAIATWLCVVAPRHHTVSLPGRLSLAVAGPSHADVADIVQRPLERLAKLDMAVAADDVA
jgi:hypothetical protein